VVIFVYKLIELNVEYLYLIGDIVTKKFKKGYIYDQKYFDEKRIIKNKLNEIILLNIH